MYKLLIKLLVIVSTCSLHNEIFNLAIFHRSTILSKNMYRDSVIKRRLGDLTWLHAVRFDSKLIPRRIDRSVEMKQSQRRVHRLSGRRLFTADNQAGGTTIMNRIISLRLISTRRKAEGRNKILKGGRREEGNDYDCSYSQSCN